MKGQKNHNPLLKVAKSIGEMFCNSLLFIAIAFFALGLGAFVHWLEKIEAGTFLIWTCQFAEHALLVMDVAALLKRAWTHLTSNDEE